MERRCREAQALTAFMWLAIPLWIGAVAVSVHEYFKEKEGGREGLGRTAKPVRVMSQV